MDASILIFVLFIAVMYLLLIRPQQKRQKDHRQMLESLRVGDDVVTIGGMHGRVDTLTDSYVDLEVTEDIVLRFQRSSIAKNVAEETAAEPEAPTS
ncbi:MAG: preprotein translocase subunit YajC [Nitriliruptorales bacterium]